MHSTADPASRTLPIGRALLLAFTGLVLLVSAAAWAIARWQAGALVREYSRLVTRNAEVATEDLVRDVFEPIERRLLTDRTRIERGQVRRYDPRALLALFLPAFDPLVQSGSMMIGDATGYQFLVLRYHRAAYDSPLLDGLRADLPPPDPGGDQYLTRDVRREQWGDESVWTLLADDTTPLRRWTVALPGYEPRERPWYRAAVEGERRRSTGPADDAKPAASWTEPYALFTTKSPGISASVAARDPDGELVVVAYDVLLDTVSEFTRAHRPSEHGVVFVFDDQGRAIGLPADERFDDPAARAKALLSPIDGLGLPLADATVTAWRQGRFADETTRPLAARGVGEIWASVERVRLDSTHSLWIGVAVPQEDLLATIRRSERFVLGLAIAGIAIAALLAALVARRFARPLRELAARSRRIADLDLAPSPPIHSRIREVHQLARSLDEMRGALASDRDERQAGQQSLEASEQRFRRLVEHVADPIVLFDLDGRVIDFNRAACRESGYDAESFATINVAELAPDWPGPGLAGLGTAMTAGEPLTVRADLRRRDGSVYASEVRIGLVASDAERPLLLAVARDVSAREQLELEARHSEKLAAIGQLSGGIAHDFNNLITVLMGCADSLRSALPSDAPEQEDARVILETSARAAEMTRQLLALSRRQRTAPLLLSLADEIPRIADTLLRLVGEDIDVRLDIDRDISPVEMDRGELQQLLLNLAANARDAMPQGGRIVIAARDYGDGRPGGPPRQVEMVVSDTGVGMSREVLEKIFEPFFTTKLSGKGTGLGLATCAAIVDRAGGRIWAKSEPGLGSSFIVRLPACAEEKASEFRLSPAEGVDLPGTAETILLVEDESGVRSIAERVLSARGFDLVVAVDGVDALARLEGLERPPDLLLTDVVMPRMGGVELALHVRERMPGVGLLFMSGYADHESVNELVRRGAAFLAKPFSPAQLVRSVRDALAHRTPPGIERDAGLGS